MVRGQFHESLKTMKKSQLFLKKYIKRKSKIFNLSIYDACVIPKFREEMASFNIVRGQFHESLKTMKKSQLFLKKYIKRKSKIFNLSIREARVIPKFRRRFHENL